MKKAVLIAVAWIVLCSSSATAQNFLPAERFKQWLESGTPVIIVDIQPQEGYARRHFKGSIATDAFPVESEGDKAKLGMALNVILNSKDNAVIVRREAKMGRVSAARAYDYFLSKGVPEKRLFILEGGIDAWPYPDLLIQGR